VAACGSSSSDAPLAQVGGYKVTPSLVNQWMTPMVGEDFYAVAGRPAPAGLVAEPANYPACVAALKRLTPIPGGKHAQPEPTTADLERRCRQLYEAIKHQTLTFLVKAYWSIDFAASHGVSASSAEVQQYLDRLKATEYSAPGQLQNHLADRGLTLRQQLFELKLELLQEKLLHKALASSKQAALALAAEAQGQSSPASCDAADVVEHCKGYKAPGGYPGPPPAAQLAEIVSWRPATTPSPGTASPTKAGSGGPGLAAG
jgi:hypothetical protein